MGIFQKIGGEFIDIIQWTEPADNDILAYRFERYHNEIKMGAQLTVREGQTAIFVNEGKLADVFTPGMYRLQTQNLPILSTLKGWKYGFDSPFRAEVYFIATRQFTDLKWGTPSPIMVRDPEFGPLRIRAFGTYAMHVSDPTTFLRQQVATNPVFETFQISAQMRDTIVSRFTDVLGQAHIAALDLAGNYDKVAKLALEKIRPDLAALGVELTLFYIENISLPDDVNQALDTRSKMGVLGDMGQFTRYQTATAIPDAAKNPGGIAGIGAGLGVGLNIGNQMSGALAGSANAGPPPLPAAVMYYVAVHGSQTGPFDMPTLAAQAQAGTLSADTLVWTKGMAAWAKAGEIKELQALFAAAVPPPIPAGGT